MDVQRYSNGIKIGAGKTSVYINPDEEIKNGVVIYTLLEGKYDTNDDRLVIEGPGEYEYQGIEIKGNKKDETLSFVINYNDREVYYTSGEGIESVPDDESYDAVIVEVDPDFDPAKASKTSYPTIFVDKGNILESNTEAERVKNINLRKLTPEDKNLYILQ